MRESEKMVWHEKESNRFKGLGKKISGCRKRCVVEVEVFIVPNCRRLRASLMPSSLSFFGILLIPTRLTPQFSPLLKFKISQSSDDTTLRNPFELCLQERMKDELIGFRFTSHFLNPSFLIFRKRDWKWIFKFVIQNTRWIRLKATPQHATFQVLKWEMRSQFTVEKKGLRISLSYLHRSGKTFSDWWREDERWRNEFTGTRHLKSIWMMVSSTLCSSFHHRKHETHTLILNSGRMFGTKMWSLSGWLE